jgi:hypothetical protein
MSGIFYDPHRRRVVRVQGTPEPTWTFVTHSLTASANQCRRIMREWIPPDELFSVDWSSFEAGSEGARSA